MTLQRGCLQLCQQNPLHFHPRFATGDEILINHNTHETKEEYNNGSPVEIQHQKRSGRTSSREAYDKLLLDMSENNFIGFIGKA